MILGAIPQRCLSRPAEIVRCCLSSKKYNRKNNAGKNAGINRQTSQWGKAPPRACLLFLRQVGRAGRMKCGTEVGDGTSV